MKKYYIKERHNPQLSKPIYTKLGQLTKKQAQRFENSIYGDNYILPFETKEDYDKKIKEIESKGFTIYQTHLT